jgi:hypothetical protein
VTEDLRRIGVPGALAVLIIAGSAALVIPGSIQAAAPSREPPWDPPPCPPGASMAAGPAVWFAVDPELDAEGWLVAQGITVGDLAGRTTHRLELPPESFAAGPVAGRVLVGDDDGSRSRLRLVSVAAGCAMEIANEPHVIRSAVLTPDGRTAWEHRVDRVTRSDEGVWRRPLDGGPARRVLPGLEPDPDDGPTFSTELALGVDGQLAVASCGAHRCRIRALDPATLRVDHADDTGWLLGIAGGRIVAYAACPGFPCPIISIDARSGDRAILVDGAGPASLAGTAGNRLVYETEAGGLALLDLDTHQTMKVDADGRLPVGRTSGATSGADSPATDALLAPAGHLSMPAAARYLDVATGDIRPLPEVEP